MLSVFTVFLQGMQFTIFKKLIHNDKDRIKKAQNKIHAHISQDWVVGIYSDMYNLAFVVFSLWKI